MNEDNKYNGWANWQTWNVILWLSNDETLYKIARQCVHYKDIANKLANMDIFETPDGANYSDPDLDTYALDEWLMDEVA